MGMSSNNFPAVMRAEFLWEGKYCNVADDPGGPTNMGITIATLSHELGRKATIADVKNLSVELAIEIYRKKFWNTIDGDALPDGVDLIAMDIAVNSGPGRALQWLEKTKNLHPIERIHVLDKMRLGFWRGLPIFRKFGVGWARRETDILARALRMAKA
jgi:lysozyme family protein